MPGRPTTIYDLTSLRVRADGRRVASKSKDIPPEGASFNPKSVLIADDAGGTIRRKAVRRKRREESEARNLQQPGIRQKRKLRAATTSEADEDDAENFSKAMDKIVDRDDSESEGDYVSRRKPNTMTKGTGHDGYSHRRRFKRHSEEQLPEIDPEIAEELPSSVRP
jgi:hypothetical protein